MLDVITPVRAFIVENFLFGDAAKLAADDTSFLNSGIIDSTGLLEVIQFLEETFAIKIEDDELLPENLDSLVNIQKFVERKKTN
ncbi:MAG: acyl carrier protein [Chitinispirillaceae bacterium]|nr:acyl carrier protein [Chitinispirillaceae bacterium]